MMRSASAPSTSCEPWNSGPKWHCSASVPARSAPRASWATHIRRPRRTSSNHTVATHQQRACQAALCYAQATGQVTAFPLDHLTSARWDVTAGDAPPVLNARQVRCTYRAGSILQDYRWGRSCSPVSHGLSDLLQDGFEVRESRSYLPVLFPDLNDFPRCCEEGIEN